MHESTAESWLTHLEQHRQWICRVLWARLGCQQAVEDVWGELQRDAVTAGDQWATVERPGPWLYQVALRKSLEYRRGVVRRRNRETRYAEVRPQSSAQLDTAVDPLDVMLRFEQQQQMRDALQQLPEGDAELLILKYVESWDYRRIAEHLKLRLDQVTYRLRAARGRLKAVLLAEDADGE